MCVCMSAVEWNWLVQLLKWNDSVPSVWIKSGMRADTHTHIQTQTDKWAIKDNMVESKTSMNWAKRINFSRWNCSNLWWHDVPFILIIIIYTGNFYGAPNGIEKIVHTHRWGASKIPSIIIKNNNVYLSSSCQFCVFLCHMNPLITFQK